MTEGNVCLYVGEGFEVCCDGLKIEGAQSAQFVYVSEAVNIPEMFSLLKTLEFVTLKVKVAGLAGYVVFSKNIWDGYLKDYKITVRDASVIYNCEGHLSNLQLAEDMQSYTVNFRLCNITKDYV